VIISPGAAVVRPGPAHRLSTGTARDPPGERLLRFVEDRQLVFAADVVLDIAVGIEDRDRLAVLRIAVGAARHPIAHIVGE